MSNRWKTVLIIVLAAMCVYVYARRIDLAFPTVNAVAAKEKSIAALRLELSQARAAQRLLDQQMADAKALSTYFWLNTGRAPKAEIKQAIEGLGSRTGLSFTRLDRPEAKQIGDDVDAVDLRVHATTDAKTLARFMRAVDEHKPILQWHNCLIRPDRYRDPKAIIISGVIRGYVLGAEATAFLNEDQLL